MCTVVSATFGMEHLGDLPSDTEQEPVIGSTRFPVSQAEGHRTNPRMGG